MTKTSVPVSGPWTESSFCGILYIAFVALVLPFESLEAPQGGLLRPQKTDQETQRNSNIVNSGPVGVAHVRLASEGTRNSKVV